ncbi:MAG: ATP-binding protein [Acidobacteriota bacterium]|nr:ATP-binding protein [Acidobacteriota bacterium]
MTAPDLAAAEYATSIVDTVRAPLVLLSEDLRVVTANASFFAGFGGSLESVQGRRLTETGDGKWDVPALRSCLEEVLPERLEVRDFEVVQPGPAGRSRTLLLNARQLQHAGGAVQMILVAIEDVTERHRLARELAEAMRELGARNRELQDFASVASHDLQEPLRKIQAFSGRLTNACGEALPAEARDYLARIQSAAGRMSVLINDLLSLTRVLTRGQTFTGVDLQEVANGVLTDLEETIARAGARVTTRAMAAVDADPTQMRQLLQNMIGNAIKFRGPGPCEVEVFCESGSESCRLTVEDNGIGFDQKYAERIFDPFRRLHLRGEFEGTGIGLALCRRIMERHGGSIHAESRPEGGARFIATFPNSRVQL